MRFRLAIPRFATSTVEAGRQGGQPVLDGKDVVVVNRWNIPPHTVALVGRPAVWFSFDVATPKINLGFFTIPSKRLVWEQDFGGHLFVAITDADDSRVTIIEAGPANANGTGALVPFAYPEDSFAKRGVVDFAPIVIAPPHGLSEEFFAQLVRTTQRAYDGNQRYLAVEIPFLRVGRDSNSYAIGVLICCGIDPREVPKPQKAVRWEWTGYPGAEDPVHRANFGLYLGAPSSLGDGVMDLGFHNEDGSVRHVVVGGSPNERVRLPDGEEVQLDARGRIAFAPDDARRHLLPTTQTQPPEQIRRRRRFPQDPSASGAEITLIVDGRAVALEAGTQYSGKIVERHESLAIVRLRNERSEIVLPIVELGAEMRDPKRVDRLFRVGTELTVGLHRDRHPRLVAHGDNWLRDRIRWRQLHVPRWQNVGVTSAIAIAVFSTGIAAWWFRER